MTPQESSKPGKAQYEVFTFESFGYDPNEHALNFNYRYDNDLTFTEKLFLPKEVQWQEDSTTHNLGFALHLALGMSYWKAYALPDIKIQSGELTKDEASFWSIFYTKGLGEFFYKNQIDFHKLINFPNNKKPPEKNGELSQPLNKKPTTNRLLVPLGGGKDSATTIAILQQHQQPFDTFSLGNYDLILNQAAQLKDSHHYVIRRQIDPKLLELNNQGVYNGHVPITLIYSLSALLIAALKGHEAVLISNERSANEGNVEYLGEIINHQWSKSLEAEHMLQNYLENSIDNQLSYFSLLRPFSELQVAQIFAKLSKWQQLVTSCNRNFTQKLSHNSSTSNRGFWCGECAKCLFVFICLATVLSKEALLKIFGGQNLFEKANLWPLLIDLLGRGKTKPFDCVGTPEEVEVAFKIITKKNEFADSVIVKKFTAEIMPTVNNLEAKQSNVFTISNDNAIPSKWRYLLENLPTA